MRICLVLALILLPSMVLSQDRLVRLYAPPALVETGLLKHILPRFSLKTQVRVELVEDAGAADFRLGSEGTAVFQDGETLWSVSRIETPATTRLLDWMTSDVGRRTIFGFAPDGAALFSAPNEAVVEVVAVEVGENADLGHTVSRIHCARCHAVDEATRKSTIGSTPSFFVLRSFEDWESRFSAFYVLAPHGAFT